MVDALYMSFDNIVVL